jgi:membrane protein DedA with SNARE-associated domain
MTLESILENYGYIAILIGTFLEGETILILGGITAKLGYLQLYGVILAGFAGTFFGDQMYFFLGRYKGHAYLGKRPQWHNRSMKVFTLLQRHETWLILGFRFLYGMRTITPFIIGMSQVSTPKYITLNAIGASIWAIVIAMAGYLFGHALDLMIGDIKQYELELLGLVAIAGLLIWAYKRIRERNSTRK